MSNKPTISVVMPGYNAERFLKEAIDSVLAQTFTNFELIFINDGSTDSTESIVKSINDPRIVYLDNGENKGLAYSFNVGIKIARGEFIARMDADDICVKNRFAKQVAFLNSHPKVGVVGSSIIVIDENNRAIKTLKRDRDHINIKWSSLFSTPMYHPTVMARTEILKNNLYDESLSNSEDYELWSRLLFTTDTHFANMDEPLLRYRIFPNSFTRTLNLDKRAISAHNTITNIKRYVALSGKAEKTLIRIRQEMPLPISRLFIVFIAYLSAATNFCRKERLGLRKAPFIYWRLFTLSVFLTKYLVKEIYHIFR